MRAKLIAMSRVVRELFALGRVATLADLDRLKLSAANKMMQTTDSHERAIRWQTALLLLDIQNRQRTRAGVQ